MPDVFARNPFPPYYTVPKPFRASIGAAAITMFPSPATAAAIAAITGAQAGATMGFSGQPLTNPASSISVNGVTITFVAAGSGGFNLRNLLAQSTMLSSAGTPLPFQAVGPYGLQCELGATLYGTLLNLVGLLRCLPDDLLTGVNVRVRNNALYFTAAQTGTAGNSIALAGSTNSAVTITPNGGSASASSSTAAAAGNLAGGAAPTNGYAVLVEPGPQTTEIQQVSAICRGYLTTATTTNSAQAQTTIVGLKSDGAAITKLPALTITVPAGNTQSSTQEMGTLSFPLVTQSAPLQVQPWTGVYVYGSTTQAIDVEAGPAGVY